MRIGVIQASSQREKNPLIYECTKSAAPGHEVINFGVFPEERENWSYVETALLISLLLSGGAVDFVVTGCSSGQGMMLACNSLPGVLCGHVPTPQDAFLFGRINGGNAATKRSLEDCLERYPGELLEKVKGRRNVMEYIREYGRGPFKV